MYALAPGCLVAIGTAPATGEVHPDLDASAILSRAASITSRLAASCDRSQDRPREQPVFPHLRRCRGRRCAICCRCAPGDSLISAPVLRFRNGSETVPEQFRYGSVTVTLPTRYRRRAQRHLATPGPRQFPAVAAKPRAPGAASVQSAKFSAHCRIAAAGGRARHSAEFFAQCPPGRAPG